MITLTPITTPEKLEEYYRFRYRIYNESRLKGFVEETEGMDKDAYDERAWHFGWYVDGQLAGCIRFIERTKAKHPAHVLHRRKVLHQGGARLPRRAQGQGAADHRGSRFCLAPSTGLRNPGPRAGHGDDHAALGSARLVRRIPPAGYWVRCAPECHAF
ncbi:MAG: GNAT family N-acetyltransferase [Flavobacteriales bacterium]|nr:GNAT family N-acetyltransferase [Flavobacteriales bacterium]